VTVFWLALGALLGILVDRLTLHDWTHAGITGLVRERDRLSALRALLRKQIP